MKESMRNQLKRVSADIKRYLPANPNSWIADGVDHINIFRSSDSLLGRYLNLDFARRFNNPTLGHFRSINSAWFYLRARNRDESIRELNGAALKKYVSSIGGAKELIPNFQALILHIAYLRIKNNKEFNSLMLSTTLPFDCYQPNENGLATRFAHSGWFAEGHDEIRNAIRENRDPDFSFAMDRNSPYQNVYEGAMNILKPKHSDEEITAAKAKVIKEKQKADEEAAAAKAKQKATMKAEKKAAHELVFESEEKPDAAQPEAQPETPAEPQAEAPAEEPAQAETEAKSEE